MACKRLVGGRWPSIQEDRFPFKPFRKSRCRTNSTLFVLIVQSMANDQSAGAMSQISYHILLALATNDRHGYLIRKAVEQQTDGALRLGSGTLYASIRRL